MYAVIKTGGKQYKVSKGDTLRVEKLAVDEGSDLQIEDVLMVVDDNRVQYGTPVVEGARVSATVKAHGRGDKIKIVKFKRRKHYRRQMGHRQWYTELTINEVSCGAGETIETAAAEA